MPKLRISWSRAVLLGAALVAVLFVASGASLWHLDAPGSEATCPICHLAHMPVLPGLPAGALAEPVVIAWVVFSEADIAHAAPVALDSPPRAPPA